MIDRLQLLQLLQFGQKIYFECGGPQLTVLGIFDGNILVGWRGYRKNTDGIAYHPVMRMALPVEYFNLQDNTKLPTTEEIQAAHDYFGSKIVFSDEEKANFLVEGSYRYF